MAPSLSAKYPVTVETEIHDRNYYKSEEWLDTELPVAPAIMINDDVIVEGSDISEDELDAEILSRLR